MKMTISNDDGSGENHLAIDRNGPGGVHMSIFKNERKPESEPPNNDLLSGLMDDVDLAMKELQKETNIGNREEKNSDNKPTTRFPFDRDAMSGFNKALESIQKRFKEHEEQIKFQRDFIRPTERYYSNHYDTGITRFNNIDFKPMPKPAPVHTVAIVGRMFGGVIGGILVIMLLTRLCGKGNRSRRGTVLVPRAAVGAATVQQDLEANGGPFAHVDYPRQFTTGQTSGADPPNFDLPPPYSECINENVSEQPPSYTIPADTQPLVHNGLVEISGFRNDVVAMTTTPNNAKTELVFDNGRIVERLSLDLSKESGQGAKLLDVTNKVVYIDQKQTATRK